MTSRVASAAAALAIIIGALTATTGAAGAVRAPSVETARTHVTVTVKGCQGCILRLTQALNGQPDVWQSKSKKVKDGTAAWSVPRARTHGMSITVLAPWDGGAGYVPTVVFRYAGEEFGSTVTNAVAKTKKRASSCWAGTSKESVTLPITVRRANATNPAGDRIKTPRAYTSVTQRWEQPMYRAWRGISGTQDATYCG
jgi:hypothetical protein